MNELKAGNFWTAVPIWTGETAFIIGGGPSLRGVDLESLLKGRRVIGVNYAGLLPWTDLCWFGDCRWFDWNIENLQKHAAIKITCCERLHVVPWLRVMRRSKKRAGIDTDPQFIAWNWNSGGSAVNLAYHLGARRIVLMGFDLKRDEANNTHWHDEYKKVNPGQEDIVYTYRKFKRGFDEIASDAVKLGVEIVNATPGSALESFPICSREEALAA